MRRLGLFKIFQYLCYKLDMFVFEPNFWLSMTCVVLGVEYIMDGLKGKIYYSSRSRILRGLLLLIWSIIIIYYYWFKPFNGIKM